MEAWTVLSSHMQQEQKDVDPLDGFTQELSVF